MTLPPQFNIFPDNLRQEMLQKGIPKTIPAGVEILRAGQYIQAVPIVLSGLVKVITRNEEREFLLYYIHPNESCIMSFFGVIQEESSKIVAVTEAETELLLLPSEWVRSWSKLYPEFNVFFHLLNNLRYTDLLQTINALLFDNLDNRILAFLREKARQQETSFIKIRHREIADAMGTSREVISRVTKKLEHEKKIAQYSDGIEVRL
ncbi:Crp/Fnr family transcriptional regulator [Runella rosea]|uniref:Crp/Fnr family transcriptional regulator n=1 Tax=Runella rosea TaxID=2259595 RepID=A0A344TGB8_9BACT|nr:Crp/Fnr family transcriptional regulator [Runella rosea]AXE17689.1 Crp/Fnr family transcriptional regulator [Runella rosea]